MGKAKIAIVFQSGGECGGPYISHKRIMESSLKEKYELIPLYFPKGRMGIFCPGFIKEVRRQIRIMDPDLIQIPGLQLVGFHMMVAAVLEKRKTVLAVHGSSSEAVEFSKLKKFVMEVLEKQTLNCATGIYAVSRYVENWRILKKFQNKCYGTIFNLPQTGNWKKRDLRKELGISPKDLVIVSTGRITREKGYENFWKVLEKTGMAPDRKVIIAGDGDYLEDMKAEVYRCGWGNHVFFTGFITDIENVLAAGDIFMILSLHETFCMSLLEACQQGLPCIATDVGGIPEIICNNENGFLVRKNDIAGTVRALKQLMENEKLRLQMGRKAKERAETVFSGQRITAQLDRMYQSLIYGSQNKRLK